eukprot:TRINITY_DN278_c0_g2_i3.p1 TRINITY_DN278_c0_g2~~TRINITY_DN278_c0_g2_i3.p1  ORF type:complete len:692 (+),score=99.19 TRINITY_DN278_c0_g2_i3:242-2077(+)
MKFVEVDAGLVADIKSMARSKSLHTKRNHQIGWECHFARDASRAARNLGLLSEEQVVADLATHKRANRAKHVDSTFAPGHHDARCAGTANREAWADMEDTVGLPFSPSSERYVPDEWEQLDCSFEQPVAAPPVSGSPSSGFSEKSVMQESWHIGVVDTSLSATPAACGASNVTFSGLFCGVLEGAADKEPADDKATYIHFGSLLETRVADASTQTGDESGYDSFRKHNDHLHGVIAIDSQFAEPERLCSENVSLAQPCVSCGGWLNINTDPHFCNPWGFRVCAQCVLTVPTAAGTHVVSKMESSIATRTDICEAQCETLHAKVSSLSGCIERLAASMTQTVTDKVAGHVKELESKLETGVEIKLAELRTHFSEIVELTNEVNCSSLATLQDSLGQFAEKQSENVSKTLRGVLARVTESDKREQDKLLLILDERLAEMEHRVDIKFNALHTRSAQGPDREQFVSDQVTCIALVKEAGAEQPSIKADPMEVQEIFSRDWAWFTEISASDADFADNIVSGEAVLAAVQAQQVDVLFWPHFAGEAGEQLALDVADKGGRSYLFCPGSPFSAKLEGALGILKVARKSEDEFWNLMADSFHECPRRQWCAFEFNDSD